MGFLNKLTSIDEPTKSFDFLNELSNLKKSFLLSANNNPFNELIELKNVSALILVDIPAYFENLNLNKS